MSVVRACLAVSMVIALAGLAFVATAGYSGSFRAVPSVGSASCQTTAGPVGATCSDGDGPGTRSDDSPDASDSHCWWHWHYHKKTDTYYVHEHCRHRQPSWP